LTYDAQSDLRVPGASLLLKPCIAELLSRFTCFGTMLDRLFYNKLSGLPLLLPRLGRPGIGEELVYWLNVPTEEKNILHTVPASLAHPIGRKDKMVARSKISCLA